MNIGGGVNLDLKGVVVILVVVALLVIGAYTLGISQNPTNIIIKDSVPSLELSSPMSSDVAVSSANIAPKNTSVVTPSSHVTPAKSLLPEQKEALRFAHFRVGNRNVKGMYADGNTVWVGTSGGVIRYDLLTDQYKLFDVANGSLLSNGVFHVSKLDERIVVGTYGGGLSLYNLQTKTWKNYNIPDGLADQFVYDVQKVASGDVWIATWSGVNQVINGELDNPDKWIIHDVENTQGGLPNEWVYGLEEDKDGVMWFATEKGLAQFKNGQWRNWQHEHGLGAAYELVKDDIAFKQDPSKASDHHARQKVEQGMSRVNVAYNPNYIVSLKVDRNGIVWCGTWGGGLARFDGESWRNFTVKDGLPANHVFMLDLDKEGQLWMGTSHGLAKLNDDGESFTVMTRNDGLYADNVFSMAEAGDGTLWVGSFGGVARLNLPL